MVSQQLSRASPAEEFYIARKVMKDAADHYLANGGPAVARVHVEILASELKIYHGCHEAYLDTLAMIAEAEHAERLKAEKLLLQQQQELFRSIVDTIKSENTAQQSSASKHSQQSAHDVVLPPKLSSEKAMRLWQKLQEAGIIDEYYQPIGLTRTDVALLAEEMNIRLGDENDNLLDIKEWKPYETLWHRKNMKADLQRALKQDKTPEFRDKIKKIFEGEALR
jgi:hypothetical protein